MGNKAKYPTRAYGIGVDTLSFQFQANSTSDPAASSIKIHFSTGGAGVISTITHAATGVYLVTMVDAYIDVIAAVATVDDTADDAARATVGDVTNAGTSTPLTFKIRTTNSSGTKADLTAGRKIYVMLTLCNSSGK